jgi:hypothetical protein
MHTTMIIICIHIPLLLLIGFDLNLDLWEMDAPLSDMTEMNAPVLEDDDELDEDDLPVEDTNEIDEEDVNGNMSFVSCLLCHYQGSVVVLILHSCCF